MKRKGIKKNGIIKTEGTNITSKHIKRTLHDPNPDSDLPIQDVYNLGYNPHGNAKYKKNVLVEDVDVDAKLKPKPKRRVRQPKVRIPVVRNVKINAYKKKGGCGVCGNN